MLAPDLDRIRRAYETARDLLLAERVDGHWVGELSASALSTATAVSALAIAAKNERWGLSPLSSLIEGGVRYLIEQQNEDGGWGDTDKSYSNIATTYLAVAAIHLSGKDDANPQPLERATRYIEANGSIEGLKKRYGTDKTFVVPILTNCALAGLVPWSVVDPLPFELAVVPQKWYRFVGMPVVSYAIPALVAIGQAKFFHNPPWNPLTRSIRAASVARSLKVLRQMQPESGGYLEAVPLTSFVVMSLASMSPVAWDSSPEQVKRLGTGVPSYEVLRAGIKFLVDSVRPDGSWPIDTNLATWVTTLAINALAGAGEDVSKIADLDWLLSCQHKERHPFTGAEPGGWGWSDLSGAVPDADDTPGAMLALSNVVFHKKDEIGHLMQAYCEGRDWLFALQNGDGGWPTFCRGWGSLPFDRSGVDLTAHTIRSLELSFGPRGVPHIPIPVRQPRRIAKAFRFIEHHQRPDGSWVPLWFGNQDHPDEENPIYGTAKVLMAYRDCGRTDAPAAQRGFEYLLRCQNADGGWGGGASVRSKGLKIGDQVIESTVEETALAVEALLACRGQESGVRSQKNVHSLTPESCPLTPSALRGVAWLCHAVENNRLFDPAPIGFYFAKLWYYERLYPLVFTVSALGRALKQLH